MDACERILSDGHKPKIFFQIPGWMLGQNVLLWSPMIAAALKSKLYSEVHVIGNLARVIPPQAGLYLHPPVSYKDRNSILRTITDNPQGREILRQTLLTLSEEGDILVRAPKITQNFLKEVDPALEITLRAIGVRRVDLVGHYGPEGVQKHGLTWAKDIVPTEEVTLEDLRLLYDLKHLPAFILKNLKLKTEYYFSQFEDPSLPFDLYNFAAFSEGMKVHDSHAELLELIELRLNAIQDRNVVMALPMNLRISHKLHKGILRLQERYPTRVLYIKDFVEIPYFYEYLVQDAALFLTPDTGAAHVGMLVNPARTQVILFDQKDISQYLFDQTKKDIPQSLLGEWFVPSANYHILEKGAEKAAKKLHQSILKNDIQTQMMLLRHHDSEVREQAAVTLAKMKSPPLFELFEALDHFETQEGASYALRLICFQRNGSEFILRQLKDDENKEAYISKLEKVLQAYRFWTEADTPYDWPVEAKEDMTTVQLIKGIIASKISVHSQNKDFIYPKLIVALDNPQLRQGAFDALLMSGYLDKSGISVALPYFIQILKSQSFGEETYDVILKLVAPKLMSNNIHEKVLAFRVLGYMDEEAIPYLGEALKSESLILQVAAIHSLSSLMGKKPDQVKFILHEAIELFKDQSPYLAEVAQQALTSTHFILPENPDPSYELPHQVSLLFDENGKISIAHLQAIGKIGSQQEQAIKVLLELLESYKKPEEKLLVIEALSLAKTPTAINIIIDQIQNADFDLKGGIFSCLARLYKEQNLDPQITAVLKKVWGEHHQFPPLGSDPEELWPEEFK